MTTDATRECASASVQLRQLGGSLVRCIHADDLEELARR